MTCKECVHYEVCEKHDIIFGESKIYENVGVESICEYFKPKSRFVELPCEVGQTVYEIEYSIGSYELWEARPLETKVKAICILTENDYYPLGRVGKDVFLSREEAEKALKEREK
jgi:hypothetical protein